MNAFEELFGNYDLSQALAVQIRGDMKCIVGDLTGPPGKDEIYSAMFHVPNSAPKERNYELYLAPIIHGMADFFSEHESIEVLRLPGDFSNTALGSRVFLHKGGNLPVYTTLAFDMTEPDARKVTVTVFARLGEKTEI
jgi:hypothetical protein